MKLLNSAIFAAVGMLAACESATDTDESATLAAKAAELEESSTAQYSCSGQGGSIKAQFLGQDSIVKLMIPALSEEPVLMACQSTRVGPECIAGEIWARFNIVKDTASVKSGLDFSTSCTLAAPE